MQARASSSFKVVSAATQCDQGGNFEELGYAIEPDEGAPEEGCEQSQIAVEGLEQAYKITANGNITEAGKHLRREANAEQNFRTENVISGREASADKPATDKCFAGEGGRDDEQVENSAEPRMLAEI